MRLKRNKLVMAATLFLGLTASVLLVLWLVLNLAWIIQGRLPP
jgi:hypothetical protein